MVRPKNKRLRSVLFVKTGKKEEMRNQTSLARKDSRKKGKKEEKTFSR